MTEKIQDDRREAFMLIPCMKVVRLQEHPYEGTRHYVVVKRMLNEEGQFSGWAHVSKGYAHSTSAFSALGRLVQKNYEKTHTHHTD